LSPALLMRLWLLVPVCVLCVAATVLFSAQTQRHTSDTNFHEASTAQSLLSNFLDQERGLRDYLLTGGPDGLEDYLLAGEHVGAELRTANAVSQDDPLELAAIARQWSAWQQWQTLANLDLAPARHRHALTLSALDQRDRLIDQYTTSNHAYQARLAVVRADEDGRAALVSVWLTLGVSALFTAIGGLLVVRMRRNERRVRVAREAERSVEAAYLSTQAEFGEALQVTESQTDARRLLVNHIEASIPGSRAVALNRNNSADRLEPATPLSPDDPLYKPLEQAAPRSCLAVRLSRRYDRSSDSKLVLQCEICGVLKSSASSCRPLLVGGEVIGSVLVVMAQPPLPADRRRIDESVTQAAPVLANLRNLATAETRAATDALTGLPNKRALDDTLKRMAAQAGRTASPLSIVFLDLDHFKNINDTYGHERGDEVLAAVGAVLRDDLRVSDFAGRIGGEEFLILLPDTGRGGALEVAEKIRASIHHLGVRGLAQPVTASLGVATMPDDSLEIDTLVRTADRALYSAKQNGRDRVETSPPAEGIAVPT
jgi:diguanylate cyclase (GGDEF)-like protein